MPAYDNTVNDWRTCKNSELVLCWVFAINFILKFQEDHNSEENDDLDDGHGDELSNSGLDLSDPKQLTEFTK